MKYNLTEKLKFDEDPILVIQDKELTVKSDAATVLKLMDAVHSGSELELAGKAMELLFSEKDWKKIESLHLKTKDFMTVIQTAMSLAMGEDPDEIDTAGE